MSLGSYACLHGETERRATRLHLVTMVFGGKFDCRVGFDD